MINVDEPVIWCVNMGGLLRRLIVAAGGARSVGPWHMDEKAGQDTADASTYGRDGVLSATSGAEESDPTWSTDRPITG